MFPLFCFEGGGNTESALGGLSVVTAVAMHLLEDARHLQTSVIFEAYETCKSLTVVEYSSLRGALSTGGR